MDPRFRWVEVKREIPRGGGRYKPAITETQEIYLRLQANGETKYFIPPRGGDACPRLPPFQLIFRDIFEIFWPR